MLSRLLPVLFVVFLPVVAAILLAERPWSSGSEVSTPEPSYGPESWQTMIPDSCQSFFDGCNTCSRQPDMEFPICTLMFCAEYEAPKCLD